MIGCRRRSAWYSWGAADYGVDLGLSSAEPQEGQNQDGEMFGLNAFLRDGDRVYRTEDSPAGYPQTPPYEWWRRHDEYDHE
jgi:hypothetical protein